MIDNYDLEDGKWEIVIMFVVLEYLIIKDLVDIKGVKFILLKELDYNMFY